MFLAVGDSKLLKKQKHNYFNIWKFTMSLNLLAQERRTLSPSHFPLHHPQFGPWTSSLDGCKMAT